MKDRPADDLVELMETIGREFATANSTAAIHTTTLDVVSTVFDADLAVIAATQNGKLEPLASRPDDWTDTDGLLEPASMPSIVASRDRPYHVPDRSDVRGSVETASRSHPRSIEYTSVLSVPFGTGNVLFVGNREPATFTDGALDVLQLIGAYAASRQAAIGAASTHQTDPAWIEKAAAGLSHDAENFLEVIEGRALIARDDPQSEHVAAIERAAGRLRELIDDTRTLLETGAYSTELETVRLAEVVHDAWAVERSESARIEQRSLDPIRADRSQVTRLLENLFRNAIEHAGPTVTVRVGMLSDASGFYVEDDGPGIDPEERDSVLQFAYSTSAEHTGLGLTIVQWIAAAHGWDISITDGELGGTRFEFAAVETLS